ncbi:MAG: S-methyl-5-thioribose-1-phosphate isomerase [Oscillospiraceae bacterium]|nr:S-methyl-5-thioribose-1-phosphate isomerase [Oscillospiraceae bacterium]
MSFLNGATVGFDTKNNKAVFVDQTLLPNEYREVSTDSFTQMYDAIKTLKVRGAPAIGVFAAISLAVLMNNSTAEMYDVLINELSEFSRELCACRPTAVNLKWATEKMLAAAQNSNAQNFKRNLTECALQIMEDDITVCRKIGEYGAEILKDSRSFLTHCNAGRLAAVKYGTALAPVYVMHEQGKDIHVFCDETRPLLQGARLTSYELTSAGIDTTVICDNTASYVMKKGLVDAVLVGCDRVALNGDAANKIGTSGVAISAKHYGIPFYVCMPFSTFDPNIPNGDLITVERRDGNEISEMWYKKPMIPTAAKTLNPAFDVTDNSLITAYITEKGVFKPKELKNICR